MNNSFNDFVLTVKDISSKSEFSQPSDTQELLKLIFLGESWVSYFDSKSPSEHSVALEKQILLLESLIKNKDTTVSSVANIILKGKYDPDASTTSLKIFKEKLLHNLTDSELLILKENIRSSHLRLNQYDSFLAMKALNRNRAQVDDILIKRPDPKIKLNALLE